jgi:hypothetical protein
MALINIDIDSHRYSSLLNDLIQITTIIMVAHILINLQYPGKKITGAKFLTKGLFNKHFLNLLLYILLGNITYDLIVKEIIEFE